MAPTKHVRCIEALKHLEMLKQLYKEEEKRKKPRFWVNPFLMQRELHDLEANLLKNILWEDGTDFNNFCRMSIDQFNEVHSLVDTKIKKSDTRMRCAITTIVRLAITLRYLATGDSFRSLEFLSHISRKTISKFLPEVLEALTEALQEEYLKFPHTLGAIDGKHIRLKAPPNSGSDYFNYKGYFSVVLLAVVDAHSRFIYVDIGANGRASDVMVYKNCSLYNALLNNQLNLPTDNPLCGQVCKTPYYFIGDDIFGLSRHLMKAYNRSSNLTTSQEAYNYRLSRARMTVEMAFGRLAARFRVFHRPIEVSLETCDALIKVCCVLHNYLTRKLIQPPSPQDDCSAQSLPQTISSLPVQEHDTYKHSCKIRDNICKYCVTDGDVSYQWIKIKKTSRKVKSKNCLFRK
ncbi:PREDICTED: uncharacterized protein LOC108361357 isoform X2 [Rhagoletis zephyria]|uniref:uncharacterized protein LOC108361357 isoform X2 n=1 Tax=Rhagoletis zephyria TaxID=28612 RepID=UPI000811470C|nr:PREDICTED: uncharacterized protein LOC108361357 isoform X2 [Rhagoletis zephyria]